jgi:SAM-dependent methyltransferase
MKWLVKAITFKILSQIPGGDSLHHGFQRMTGSTRQTEERLLGKIEQSLTYWRWLQKNTSSDWLSKASHLDLGTGWLPSVPLTFYALGTARQYLVDLRRHMEPEAAVNTIKLFRAVAPQASAKFGRLPAVPDSARSLEATLEPFGMTYAAPYDALAARIAGTVGFVTATHMFCHLNRSALVAVLRSVRQLLAPGGYILAQQHLRQLFDGLDCPTPFVALRYSDWFWENIINSDMMSYNRLKVRDYREALEEAGFEVCLMEVEPGKPEDSEKLSRARIHPMFSKFTREELAARHLFLVARKPIK